MRILFACGVLQQQGREVLVDKPRIDAKWIDEDVVGALPLNYKGFVPDVVILQRPLKQALAQAIPFIQEMGIKVVVEVDDDFTSIDPANPAFNAAHPKRNPKHNFHHLLKAIHAADMLTVSTEQLARRYNHPNTVVLPNCIPKPYLKIGERKVEHDPLIVGWGGSPLTHPNDLEQMGRLDIEGAWFMALGGMTTIERLGMDRSRSVYVPWTKSIEDYAQVLTQIDIGLAPLSDSVFNRGKSWLKALEMSALGVPFVASDMPEYRKLGAGLLAKKPKEWKRHLKELMFNKELRESERLRNLEIASKHTYDDNAGRWWDAWERAYQGTKGLVKV